MIEVVLGQVWPQKKFRSGFLVSYDGLPGCRPQDKGSCEDDWLKSVPRKNGWTSRHVWPGRERRKPAKSHWNKGAGVFMPLYLSVSHVLHDGWGSWERRGFNGTGHCHQMSQKIAQNRLQSLFMFRIPDERLWMCISFWP